MLLWWLLVVVTSGLLFATGLLPAPFEVETWQVLSYEADAHYFPWIYLSTTCTLPLCIAVLPYLLGLSCKQKMCFFDLVSINQTDEDMMNLGIYGLAAFLSVSQELHVLWSPPYFSRFLAGWLKIKGDNMANKVPGVVRYCIGSLSANIWTVCGSVARL